jgi:predicted porin
VVVTIFLPYPNLLFSERERNPAAQRLVSSLCSAVRRSVVLPLLVAGYCASSPAAEWKMESSINQSLSYDDNFRMAKEPVDSLIYQLTPTLKLARRTEVWDTATDVSYGVQSYSDKSTQDQNPQRYGFNTQYRTERSSLGLGSTYSITPTRNTALQDSGNFASDAVNENWSVSPSYSYKMTELDSLIGSASYSKSTYSTAAFSNNDNQSVNLGWQRQWSERLHYSVSTFYSRFESQQSSSNVSSDSYGINLSANYMLSELWQLNGTIGGRITDTTNKIEANPGLMVVNQTTSQGFLADLSARYTGERLSSSFGLNRSLVPSGQGQLTEQTGINLDLSYQLSERLSSRMGASYQQTDSASGNQMANTNGVKRTNINLSAGLDWKLTPDWIFSASYQHRKQESKNSDTITADSNIFMLMINYNWPGLSISR